MARINLSSKTLGVEESWSIPDGEWGVDSWDHVSRYKLVATAGDGKYSVTLADNATAQEMISGGTWTPPLEWAELNTAGESIQIVFEQYWKFQNPDWLSPTYETVIYHINDSVVPTVSVAVSDATGFESIFGAYIRAESKVDVVITAAGAYGSSIVSYKTTFDDKTYTADEFTTQVISGFGSLPLAVSVTDSRGRKATTTVTIPVKNYAIPTITALAVNRCADANGNGNSGNFLKVIFDSTVFALDNLNTASYVLQYKKSTELEYTAIELTDFENQYSVSGGVYVFAADSASNYNVKLVITDGLDVGSKTAIGASVFKFFSFLVKGLGMALGKMAELPGVFEIAFQTKLTGGLMHPTLSDQTNLDEVKIPNTYAGKSANVAGYLNCPVYSATFTLTVEEAGEAGQLRQIFTTCDKTERRTFERFYDQAAWGDWICTSSLGGKLLWSGNDDDYFMSNTQTANLAEPISKQPTGAVFCWSLAGQVDAEFHYFFVPKHHIAAFAGKGVTMADCYAGMKKILYVSDTQITGVAANATSGTDQLTGLAYNNSRLVLRAVIGV